MTRTTAKLVLAIAAFACADAALARASDRQQPMHVSADRSDCTVAGNGTCVLTGNVHITQGTLEIHAARADIRQGGDGEIRSVNLTGSPVRLRQEMDSGGVMNATAAQVDYDPSQDTVVFTGSAAVQLPGRGSISGERIVYNMHTSQVQGSGGETGGRVNLIFEPRNQGATGNDGKDD